MEDFEKLGVFYLGREYDLAAKQQKPDLILYDAKDLVTHAVIVGMTGSGKTGLGISLIEEAAIDNVPVIAIDPKGDLGNLLLTFPRLAAEDFTPWVNPDDARQKGLATDAYAARQAELWRKGLAEWGQDGQRIERLRAAAEWAIYTPGSSAGVPVSILKSFAAPGPEVVEDADLFRERIGITATSLLGLIGIDADPLQSREHILLSTLFDLAWRQGRDMDLAALIREVQAPPVTRIGVLELEAFYPAKERFALVMALNSVLAAPGFAAWLDGVSLDIGELLYTPQGKPRVAVFSVAHLNDAERMFFVALLLNQILGWTRAQQGTTSLRALLYMDEIFGYLPPVGNPPSKLPLLTLLKQARAYGLGIVLATQNPVDLDYKGLSNTGTWFVGRLQTERDKARLLDGLEGVAAGTGTAFDRRSMEQTLAGLGTRIFLLNNVHEDGPVVFQTRWALSYLAGPLTRDQIRQLMAPYKAAQPGPTAPASTPQTMAAPAATAAPSAATASQPAATASRPAATASRPAATTRPAAAAAPSAPAAESPAPQASASEAQAKASEPPSLPPGVAQYYLPRRGSSGRGLVYQPRLLGSAKVHFVDARTKIDTGQDLVVTTAISDSPIPVNWEEAEPITIDADALDTAPERGAEFTPLPPAAQLARSYTTWNRDLGAWLYRSQRLELLRSPSLGEVSRPAEAERDFRIRLQQTAREKRDEALEKLRARYAPKITTLKERIRRAEQAVDKQQAQARQQSAQAAISVGATLLGALTGRKAASRSNLGRATTAVRGMSRTAEQKQDVERARETVQALEAQLAALEEEFRAQTAELQASIDPLSETLETLALRPRKTDISVQLVALVWAPYRQDAAGNLSPAWE